MTFDVINGTFEFIGAIMLTINCYRLHKDRVLKGAHWLPVTFFTAWGLWNLVYYPSLDQWFSFAGGCAIVTVNLVWLMQAWYWSSVNAAEAVRLAKLCPHGINSDHCPDCCH